MPKSPPGTPSWQSSGLIPVTGHIDRPVSAADLRVYPVKLKGRDISWDERPVDPRLPGDVVEKNQRMIAMCKRPDKGILEDFLKLGAAPDEDVLRFAEKWGPLDAWRMAALWVRVQCRRFKATNTEVAAEVQELFGDCWDFKRHAACGPDSPGILPWPFGGLRREPTEAYRGLAGYIADILDHAAKSRHDWHRHLAACVSTHAYGPLELFGRDSPVLEAAVKARVDYLNRLAGWSLGLEWDFKRSRWTTRFLLGDTPTFAAIALHTTLAIAGADLYRCAGCGNMYDRSRTRRPKLGQDNYCPRCGRTAALLHAKRRYRKKMAEAQKLHGAGIPLPRIAEQLDTELENVERWVGLAAANDD